MDFYKLVSEARSCRRFDESAPLSEADLVWLVDCARVAPCGRNAQELRFATIAAGELCRELFTYTRWGGALKDWGGPVEGERPTGFIAVLMPERGGDMLCFDTGIACQTMQLAASSRGWGACMIRSFDQAKTAGLLNCPPELKPALLLGVGRPAEKRVLEPMPQDGSFAYWRDEKGVHHVPKRDLSELIIAKLV